MTSTKKAFTLVELIVVVAMIMVLVGAMSVSVSGAQERARIQKAVTETRVIMQAILAYENASSDHKLQTMKERTCDRGSLGFLLGSGSTAYGGKLPVLLQASLSSGGAMLDPWGHPYLVTIKDKKPSMGSGTASGSTATGFILPNFYRPKTEAER